MINLLDVSPDRMTDTGKNIIKSTNQVQVILPGKQPVGKLQKEIAPQMKLLLRSMTS